MAKTDTSGGLSAEEREAVKQRAKELREQEKAGKNRAAGEKAVLEAIAEMEPDDRVLAEGLHKVVTEVAPDLVPKTYYGMPAYANAEGKIVVFIQAASKFKTRYATIGFEDRAPSTTATCGRSASRCATGRRPSRRSSPSSFARPSADGSDGGRIPIQDATRGTRRGLGSLLRSRGYARSTGSHSSQVAVLKSAARSSTATIEGPGRNRQGFEGNQSVAVAAHVDCRAAGYGPAVWNTAGRSPGASCLAVGRAA